ncbi:hypothetical protein Tco_0151419 [Tanacetum coccineum]
MSMCKRLGKEIFKKREGDIRTRSFPFFDELHKLFTGHQLTHHIRLLTPKPLLASQNQGNGSREQILINQKEKPAQVMKDELSSKLKYCGHVRRALEIDIDIPAFSKCASLAHDKEKTRANVSASDWSVNDWSAFEGTKMLPADQSGADTSALVSPYHYCRDSHHTLKYLKLMKDPVKFLLFPVDAICPVCRKACLDSFGKHAVHCKKLSGFKYRHDMVRDILFDICWCAGISAKKEAHVNFLTDLSEGRSTLRPTDVLAFGWVRGKHACVDLTRVSPLVGLSSRGFTAGQAALKAASC